MSKISIQIVTRNSIRYIGNCLESLAEQNFADFSVVVIDNASTDGSAKYVRDNFPTAVVLENFKNLGFAKAHNQGIQLVKSEYVLVLNPDIVLTADFLAKLVFFADEHPNSGSFGGKLLRLRSVAVDKLDEEGLRDVLKTDIIDSTGLELTKGRAALDRGSGIQDTGQYDRTEEVFGISGACVLYRRVALEEIKINREYFDNDFFAYKEDVDLAWRLQLYGWTSWYIPTAVGYHHRSLTALTGQSIKRRLQQRRGISASLRAASFKNHQLMLIKNEHGINVLLGLPWLACRQVAYFGYSLLTQSFQWRNLAQFFKQLPAAWRKRTVIMSHAKAAPRDIRKWFSR